MAFNWQTFRTRTLTAAVFVIVMVLGVLWNQWSFLVLFSIVHFGCWWEYLHLVQKIQKVYLHPYVRIGLMVIGYGFMLWFCGPSYTVAGYGLRDSFSLPISGAGFAVLLVGIFQKTPIKLRSFGVASLGILYISLSWGLMIALGDEIRYTVEAYSPDLKNVYFPPFSYTAVLIPCVVILSLWINDTMAYIVGSLIGRTPLARISPKKTWEGTMGGILLAIVVVGLLFSHIPTAIVAPGVVFHFEPKTWYFIAAVASVFGTLGDLLESKLKRMADVKDSGSIMPGHGGFLDRFDSLLLAIPAVWILLYFLH